MFIQPIFYNISNAQSDHGADIAGDFATKPVFKAKLQPPEHSSSKTTRERIGEKFVQVMPVRFGGVGEDIALIEGVLAYQAGDRAKQQGNVNVEGAAVEPDSKFLSRQVDQGGNCGENTIF